MPPAAGEPQPVEAEPAGAAELQPGLTVRQQIRQATARLAAAGAESPRLDAELLLADVLGCDRARLVIDAPEIVGASAARRFDRLVRRREAREPVAYILGYRHFRRISLQVDRRVLIPRPETELLVDVALDLPPGARVVDVGTGSGAVALALADERPDLEVSGVDLSPDAVELARHNAELLGLPVQFTVADLLGGTGAGPDAVLANLPYVCDADPLPPDVAGWEPPLALFGGPDGLALVRRLVAGLPESVTLVALEIGMGQSGAVADLLSPDFAAVERLRDLSGIERVVVGRR